MLPEDRFSPERTGFRSIEKVGKFVLLVIQRFWRGCSAAILFLFLLYWLYGGIVTLLLLLAAFIGAFYHYQDALLYLPDQPEHSRIFVQSPTYLRLPFENLFLKAKDGVTLNAIFLKQAGPKLGYVPTFIMFHGNAGNIGHRLVIAHMLYAYTGCNIFLVEYRGYGKSDGSPSERGFELDAITSIEYLLARSDIDHERLILYGCSLGGAVAVKLCALEKYMNVLFAVVLENTFTSIPDMARHLFPLLRKLPLVCYKNQYRSLELIKTVETPTLFLSGMLDQLVPPKMMAQLYSSSAASIKRLATFENGTHNETWQSPGYCDAINNFLACVHEARRNGVLQPRLYRKQETTATSDRTLNLNLALTI